MGRWVPGKSTRLRTLRGSHDFLALEFALAGIRRQVPVALAVDCLSNRRSHRLRSASPDLRFGGCHVTPSPECRRHSCWSRSRLAQLSWRTRVVVILLAAAIWQTGIRAIYLLPSRAHQPIRELAIQVAKDNPDLLILHGIPSAITGFARYLPRDIPTLSWVGQLGVRRIPR